MLVAFVITSLLSQTNATCSDSPLAVYDEGSYKGCAYSIDFAGGGVSCAHSPTTGTYTCTITGAAGAAYDRVQDEATNLTQRPTLNFTGTGVSCVDNAVSSRTDCTISSGSGAPTDATYITQTANASLSAEQALGALGTGILKNTTTSGVLSIAVAGDFPTLNQNTTGTAAALTANPADCSAGQYAHTIAASGALTCAQVPFVDLFGTVGIDQGGTTEISSTEDAVLVGASTTDWQPKVLPSCSSATASKLLYNSTTNTFSCGTDQAAANTVEVSIAMTSEGVYSTTITGQAWVTATSKILCAPFADTSVNATVELYDVANFTATASNRVAGVGFDLRVFSPNGVLGTFFFHCTGA